MKTVWHWLKDRYISLQDRTIDSHICDQLIFVKGVKVFQWKKEFSTTHAGKSVYTNGG